MASKPDLRYGPSAESSDFTSSDEAHFRSQLWARVWTRYKLALFHCLLIGIYNVRPELRLSHCIIMYPRDQRTENIWFFFRIAETTDTFPGLVTCSMIHLLCCFLLTMIGNPSYVKLEYNKMELSSCCLSICLSLESSLFFSMKDREPFN